MNTQNTAVHIRLWNRNFWLMSIANLLLSVGMTMLIPTLPQWLRLTEGLTDTETGIVMGAFAIGLFLPGAFCSFLVQNYRRNMVCVWAIVALAAVTVLPLYAELKDRWLLHAGLRLLQGAAYGLAQMVLTSTLIIDTCQPFQRTEANHSATWFSRFALSIGPVAGIVAMRLAGYQWVLCTSAGCCLMAALLTLTVHFPFRVPSDELHVVSFDRFLLTSGWPLLLFLFLFTLAVGMILSRPLDEHFYGLLMVGFLLALLAQRFVFPDADLKSEVVSGLLLTGASLLVLLTQPASPLFAPLLGFGIGLVASRVLLFFVKLSHHCQRGTSQSTFMLGWESGLAAGLGVGYCLFADDGRKLTLTSLAIVAATLLAYVGGLHNWFIHHKNR